MIIKVITMDYVKVGKIIAMDYEKESFGGYMDKPMTQMNLCEYHSNYIYICF